MLTRNKRGLGGINYKTFSVLQTWVLNLRIWKTEVLRNNPKISLLNRQNFVVIQWYFPKFSTEQEVVPCFHVYPASWEVQYWWLPILPSCSAGIFHVGRPQITAKNCKYQARGNFDYYRAGWNDVFFIFTAYSSHLIKILLVPSMEPP